MMPYMAEHLRYCHEAFYLLGHRIHNQSQLDSRESRCPFPKLGLLVMEKLHSDVEGIMLTSYDCGNLSMKSKARPGPQGQP